LKVVDMFARHPVYARWLSSSSVVVMVVGMHST
jgi:hypothetical protein